MTTFSLEIIILVLGYVHESLENVSSNFDVVSVIGTLSYLATQYLYNSDLKNKFSEFLIYPQSIKWINLSFIQIFTNVYLIDLIWVITFFARKMLYAIHLLKIQFQACIFPNILIVVWDIMLRISTIIIIYRWRYFLKTIT